MILISFGFEFCQKLIFYSSLNERRCLIDIMGFNCIRFLVELDKDYFVNESKRLLSHVNLPIYLPLLKKIDETWLKFEKLTKNHPNDPNDEIDKICDYLKFVDEFESILISRSHYGKSCASEKIYHLQKLFAFFDKNIKNCESYHLTKQTKLQLKKVVHQSVDLYQNYFNSSNINQIKYEDLIIISYFLEPDDFFKRTLAILKILPKLSSSVINCGHFYLVWVIRLCYNGKPEKILSLVEPIDFTPLFFNEIYPHVSFHFDTIAPFLMLDTDEICCRLQSLNKFHGVCWSFISFYLYLTVDQHEQFFASHKPQSKSVALTINEIVGYSFVQNKN